MKKLIACILSAAAIMSFCSCSKTRSMIEWVDFVKINDNSFEASDVEVPEKFVGEKLGEVTGNVPFEVDGEDIPTPKNGEASAQPVGAEIYAINGFSKDEYVAVLSGGKYTVYMLHGSDKIAFVDDESAFSQQTVQGSSEADTTASQTKNEIGSISGTVKPSKPAAESSATQNAPTNQTNPNVGYDSEVVGHYKTSEYFSSAGKGASARLLKSQTQTKSFCTIHEASSDDMVAALSQYDDTYFSSGALLVIELHETSGSNKITVTDVDSSGSKIEIKATRSVPEIGTCDMAYWYIIIKVGAENYKSVELELNGAKQTIAL